MIRLGLIVLLLAAGCTSPDGRQRVLLVTTTTVEDSGLLDTLVAAYHDSQGRYHVATTAVGSGAALALGRRGDADVLLTHDPVGEAAFMADGLAAEQGPVMENEFVIAGPAADPAGARGASLEAALTRIAGSGAPFVSRADDSGTHRKETELWRRAGRDPPRDGYIESGSGMAETLRLADQRRGYVLTDLGTFRHLSGGLELEVLSRNDPPEANRYRYTIPVDPASPDGARDFITWLLGPGQGIIGSWGVERFGDPLFDPVRHR